MTARRLLICDEVSNACSYWQHWFDSKGLKWEIMRGRLWRMMDKNEWLQYRKDIGPQERSLDVA